jgi:lipid-binding SYLF domain-containing protein
MLCAAFVFGQSDAKKEEKGGTERERVKESGEVLKEVLDVPDKGIPKSVLDSSKCVIVLPSVKKAADGDGDTKGRGVMSCRTGEDYKGATWTPPIMMASSGGNIGSQNGGEATDFVILVMNDAGAKSVLSNKVKLGADASAAAGPVGGTAEASTNASTQAQVLSYSRSQGVFGGVSLSGSTLRSDGDANKNLYGQDVKPKEIITGRVLTPPEASQLIVELHESQPPSAQEQH